LIAVSETEPTAESDERTALPSGVFFDTIRRLAGGRVLVVGTPDCSLVSAATEAGVTLEIASLPTSSESSTLPDLEHLRYVPESFDGVIVLTGLERFASPSVVFERARLWLRADGTLLVGGWDMGSLPARLRQGAWIRIRSHGAHYLMSLAAIRRYAARYGFYVGAVRTCAQVRDVASSVAGSDSPSWLIEVVTAPLALVSSVFGMGPLVVVRLSKGSLTTTRAIRVDNEAEAKRAQGLAPAMFTGD